MTRSMVWIAGALMWISSMGALGHGTPPSNLMGVSARPVRGLTTGPRPIIVNDQYARVLGKALFWDTGLGSDGVACASCHYHAGADVRVSNLFNPGQRHLGDPTSLTFQPTASGSEGGVAYRLKPSDFPMWQFKVPSDKSSAVTFSTDDVVGSLGAYLGQFQNAFPQGLATDQCSNLSDPIFHIGSLNTRQTTDRNAPTVINSVFDYRLFWDGRANNIFNGENNWGLRDRSAGAWVTLPSGKAVKRNLNLADAALASQAVQPVNNAVEMACKSRVFAEVAVKILDRKPLQSQTVSGDDFELGPFAVQGGKGLQLTYSELIRKAFSKGYWRGRCNFGVSQSGVPYSMMQANFPMFFGLAVMEYERTLISNHSPYDTAVDAAKVPSGLDAQQRRGLDVFLTGHCHNCHGTPAFTAAAEPYFNTPKASAPRLLQRREIETSTATAGSSVPMMQDTGFAVTSVVPTAYDIGAGGKDPFGNPLSFADEYLDALAHKTNYLPDGVRIYSCDFEVTFDQDWTRDQLTRTSGAPPGNTCKGYKEYSLVPKPSALNAQLALPGQGKAATATAGAFKISTLRNIELTAPYFHNGSVKNLEEVVEFYSRGGNLTNPGHSSLFVFPQSFTATQKADLVAFLKSLTDEDVRWERGVFSHPELTLPVQALSNQPSSIRSNLTGDEMIVIPAVGKGGRSVAQGPLKTFEELLKQP